MKTKLKQPAPSAPDRAELVAALAELDCMTKALAGRATQMRLSERDPLYLLLLSLQHNTDVALVVATGFLANERKPKGGLR